MTSSSPSLNGIPNGLLNGTTHAKPLVDPSLLPSSKASTLRLVRATPQENERQLRSNGAAWKGALNLEQYLRREAVLASQDMTRDGGLTPWVLVDDDLPTLDGGERVVLSGCESFYKRGLLRRPGSMEVEDVVAHGVGSVFCPPEFRKRGYAGVMMRLLAQELSRWKLENEKSEVVCSMLYSDIGKEFYAKCGWEPFESTHVSLPVQSNETPIVQVDLPLTRPIESQDLPTLCHADELMQRRWMEKQGNPEKNIFMLVANVQTMTWAHAREEFICQEFLSRYPSVKGALVSLGEGKNAWCYWTRAYYNEDMSKTEGNTFYILRTVVEESIDGTEEGELAVAALLQAAQREAGLWNMSQVMVWNPSEQTVRATARALGKKVGDLEIVDRQDESITSLLWYGEDGKGKNPRDVVQWAGNDKFGWC